MFHRRSSQSSLLHVCPYPHTHILCLFFGDLQIPPRVFLIFFPCFPVNSPLAPPIGITGWQEQTMPKWWFWLMVGTNCPLTWSLLVFVLKMTKRAQSENALSEVFTCDSSVPPTGMGVHWAQTREFSPLSKERSSAVLNVGIVIKARW